MLLKFLLIFLLTGLKDHGYFTKSGGFSKNICLYQQDGQLVLQTEENMDVDPQNSQFSTSPPQQVVGTQQIPNQPQQVTTQQGHQPIITQQLVTTQHIQGQPQITTQYIQQPQQVQYQQSLLTPSKPAVTPQMTEERLNQIIQHQRQQQQLNQQQVTPLSRQPHTQLANQPRQVQQPQVSQQLQQQTPNRAIQRQQQLVQQQQPNVQEPTLQRTLLQNYLIQSEKQYTHHMPSSQDIISGSPQTEE